MRAYTAAVTNCSYICRRTGITVAGKRIQKGCDVHRSGDYLNEVQAGDSGSRCRGVLAGKERATQPRGSACASQMLHSLAKSPYIVSLHGNLGCIIARQVQAGIDVKCRSCSQGIFDSEREFWTVMELCAGGRLSDWLGRYANTAKTIVQQLLEAGPMSQHKMQRTYDHPLRKQ